MAAERKRADHEVTIILIGAMAVGKSSIMRQYIKGTFDDLMQSTMTTAQHVVEVKVDGKDVRLLVNDTAGQERFDAIVGQYFRGAHGVIVVFDVTDPAGLRDAESWLNKAQVHCSSNALPPRMVAVGNKVDLKETRVITPEAGAAWAEDHGMQLLETSALDGSNVKEAFTTLVQDILADAELAAATQPQVAKLAAATVSIAPSQRQGSMEGSCCG